MISQLSYISGGVCAPEGFVGNAVAGGIKNPDAPRLDMAVLYSTEPCVSAGTFTTNRVKAASVKLTQANLKKSELRAVFAHSGNANACTGVRGIEDAKVITKTIASHLGLKATEVGICSTGVIGLPLPMMRIEPKLDDLLEELSPDAGESIAKAIMTSDTKPKEIAVEVTIGGEKVRIGACCKGAGMISPCMATMICLITTDAKISRSLLDKFTHDCVEHSFNRITIDGDMSTNDTVLVMANGASEVSINKSNTEHCRIFREALQTVMLCMAKHIVQDGERVTKFVTVHVKGARTYLDAQKVAEAVAKSALVKSSWNGNDPNWGRILHAVGYSQARIREELVDIDIAGLSACVGGLASATPVDSLREAVQNREFSVVINLNQGKAEYMIYTTDLSPEYVDFNRSEYAYWNQAKADGLSK